ncbi:hypothetical protein E2C01_016645 [Portunus trituberculatus]|uniref:Secreted protein n=1 Tax=Portunus trituberculatus TaxID=210409 RepID=A0A5B7DQ77_PORTR|nr:hypothetical protein [Portunus trituberculatus]
MERCLCVVWMSIMLQGGLQISLETEFECSSGFRQIRFLVKLNQPSPVHCHGIISGPSHHLSYTLAYFLPSSRHHLTNRPKQLVRNFRTFFFLTVRRPI